MLDEERKQAEIGYPAAIGEAGRRWLETKPFGNEPRETARLLIDFGYAVQLLDLRPGMSLVELGCGPGWMTIFAARHGVEAAGYDIAPEMIEIARRRAETEGVQAEFEVGDMENLDLRHRFDACLIYDALHHTPRADLVVAAAHRALKTRGRLLLAEPNWKHRYQGRGATGEFGTTELGYTPRRLKRLLRDAGFHHVQRFHNNRKRLYGNSPREIAAHVAEPLVYRFLSLFWTQIWLRATAR
ncbi:MAG TPA: class I SAM-dependent methyltransferase [Gaiellaceae bacterium]|nr:class I SAM-dependent methyltransferase [Gaiellaceae bacterium]